MDCEHFGRLVMFDLALFLPSKTISIAVVLKAISYYHSNVVIMLPPLILWEYKVKLKTDKDGVAMFACSKRFEKIRGEREEVGRKFNS